MAFKDKQTRKERLSSVVAGDTRRYGGGRVTRSDFAGNLQQGYGGGGLGMPVATPRRNIKQAKIQNRVPTTRSIGGVKAYGIALAVPKPKPKPPQVIRTTVSERTTPVSAPATAPARMAVNRATGNTTGFTSGKTTNSTVTKAGVATKTGGTAYQQMQRNALEKSGVVGPRKDSSGRNVSSMTGNRTATSNASRPTNSRFPGK